MLLVCRTDSDVFYFSLLMEQDPKRAFLVEHKKLNKTNKKTMANQELVVLEDSNEVKIMSSFPNIDAKNNCFKATNQGLL